MVPLQRSESIESTQSEREFRKRYQAITHRMVHRKSSAVMYSRILERTFGELYSVNTRIQDERLVLNLYRLSCVLYSSAVMYVDLVVSWN